LLPNGTKEEILNLLARESKTISQLAEALDLSPPSVHMHINDMLKSALLREYEAWGEKYPTERSYEPNLPVFKAEECAELGTLCEEMARKVGALFERKRAKMERAFAELEAPFSDGLVSEGDAAHGRHLFDIAEAHGQAKIQPDAMVDDLRYHDG
jgi:DNA-binding Lrp family transcriptional regulator